MSADIVERLRDMSRRGYWPLLGDEAADEITRLRTALAERAAVPEEPAAGAWDGAEEWMPLAWELCADECGEEACNELVWEGGPIPEPWGDRWLKYEGEAKRLIALVRKHVPMLAAAPQPPVERAAVPAQVVGLTDEQIDADWREACSMHDLTQNMVRAFARTVVSRAALTAQPAAGEVHNVRANPDKEAP